MPIQQTLCISTTAASPIDSPATTSATASSLDKLSLCSPMVSPYTQRRASCKSRFDCSKTKPYCMKSSLVAQLNAPLPRHTNTGILHPGAVFKGIQCSNHNEYSVTVRIVNVDLNHSHLSAFLDINGLTPAQADITTYLEAEIIGPQYSFCTRKWDANDEVDREHWTKFPEYDPDHNQEDVLFMRWKELFLVPDHKQKSIDGASFSGFYYVAFNLRCGTIVGYYYSKNSEWFQRLDLHYCPPLGFPSFDMC